MTHLPDVSGPFQTLQEVLCPDKGLGSPFPHTGFPNSPSHMVSETRGSVPQAQVEILSSQGKVYETVASSKIRRSDGESGLFGCLGGIFPVERFGISTFIFLPLRFLAN